MKNRMSTDPEFGFGTADGMKPSPLFVPQKKDCEPVMGVSGLCHAINSDGFNGEMQVNLLIDGSPHTGILCMRSMMDTLYEGLCTAGGIARKFGVSVLVGDIVKIDKSTLPTAPAECFVAGCNPTFDVDSLSLKEVLPNYMDAVIKDGVPLGGHIHFIDPPVRRTGKMDVDISATAEFVKFASKVALLPMMLIGWSKNRLRRLEMLGFGNFRMPNHGGVEMKDFSGFSLNSLGLFAMQYGYCRAAFSLWLEYPDVVKKINEAVSWEVLKEAVMNGSKRKMLSIYKKIDSILSVVVIGKFQVWDTNPYTIFFDKNLNATGVKSDDVVSVFDLVYNNPELVVCDDFSKKWGEFKIRGTQNKGVKSFITSRYDYGPCEWNVGYGPDVVQKMVAELL